MEINIWSVVLATIVQFIIGGAWYSVIFGKQWGEIHGFNKLSKEKQKEMAASMGPWYGAQLVVTIITAVVLAKLVAVLPEYSPFALAVMVWIGFVVPTQFSAVVFGGTESKWIMQKLTLMTLGSLACLLGGAAVFAAF